MLNGGNFKRKYIALPASLPNGLNNTVNMSEVCFISVFEVTALTIISHKLVTFRATCEVSSSNVDMSDLVLRLKSYASLILFLD